MRIWILDPHWKQWIWSRIQVISSRFTEFFEQKIIFKFLLNFFPLIFILKLDNQPRGRGYEKKLFCQIYRIHPDLVYFRFINCSFPSPPRSLRGCSTVRWQIRLRENLRNNIQKRFSNLLPPPLYSSRTKRISPFIR